MSTTIECGNNIEVLKNYPDNHFDSVVTDPPYGLGQEPNAEKMLQAWITTGYLAVEGVGFMGKEWDAFVPQPLFWKEVFRVLKPGGHILSFFGTRTYDWGCMGIRLAGFEIRDCLQWIYGSGFPKSHNISKAMDKKPHAAKIKEFKGWLNDQIENSARSKKEINDLCEFTATSYSKTDGNDNWSTNLPTLDKWQKMKEVVGITDDAYDFIIEDFTEERGYVETTGNLHNGSGNNIQFSGKQLSDSAYGDHAKQWAGWGSALKPSNEPIVLARKPLEKGLSIVENVMKWGTGGINIDGCRVSVDLSNEGGNAKRMDKTYKGKSAIWNNASDPTTFDCYSKGRFPSNTILTHHPECECVGLKKVKGSSCSPEDVGKGREGDFSNGIYGAKSSKVTVSHTDDNGEEVVENWNCHDDCPIKILDEQSGTSKSAGGRIGNKNGAYSGIGAIGFSTDYQKGDAGLGDVGGASRFFYVAKASQSERNWGLGDFESKRSSAYGYEKGLGNSGEGMFKDRNPIKQNYHPTVKPVNLMRYLIRMITPPGGICLDPFNGSGTTGIGCKLEGIDYVGIDRDQGYCDISKGRIENWTEELETMITREIKESKKDVSQLGLDL